MKKQMTGMTLCAALAMALTLSFFHLSCATTPSDEEIRKTIEIKDIETKWVQKLYQPWPKPRLILVPSVTFRVKNISEKPLHYVNFNGIFKFKDDTENLGDNFLAAIRGEPVLPGELSEKITLKSNFGVEGKNLADFNNNPQWKTVYVKIFAQHRGSRHVLLGEWLVSRDIDFKEPEPVHMGEKKEAQKK